MKLENPKVPIENQKCKVQGIMKPVHIEQHYNLKETTTAIDDLTLKKRKVFMKWLIVYFHDTFINYSFTHSKNKSAQPSLCVAHSYLNVLSVKIVCYNYQIVFSGIFCHQNFNI